MELVWIFLLGLVTSFVSNFTAGGGGLIILPVLLALGIPTTEAIGTVKVGALGLMVGSASNPQSKKIVRKDHIVPLLIVVVVASLLGPRISLSLGEEQVKVVSAVLIIITALASLLSWRVAGKTRQTKRWQVYAGYGLYFISTLFLAGFGSGVGLLSSYILIGLIGMSSLESIGTRRVLGLVGLPLQLAAFAFDNSINLKLGLALMAGMIIGGFFGLNFAIKKGSEFVKKAMAVVSILLVLSLFV